LNIKKALMEADPDFAKTISDLEYVQHAIVAKNVVSKALKRIRRLKAFKEEHGISETATVEETTEMLKRLEDLSPSMFMGFGKDDKGRYVTTWNYNAFLPAAYQNPEDWKACFSAFYYLFDAMQPDIASIREGIVMIADCEGVGWKNFSLKMEKQAAHLYQDAYPIRIKEMTMLNPPSVFKVIYALCKPFLSKRVKEVLHMNGKVDEIQNRIPIGVLPTTLGGTQGTLDMAQSMEDALNLRFENKSQFTL
jgi:hypothetical protein